MLAGESESTANESAPVGVNGSMRWLLCVLVTLVLAAGCARPAGVTFAPVEPAAGGVAWEHLAMVDLFLRTGRLAPRSPTSRDWTRRGSSTASTAYPPASTSPMRSYCCWCRPTTRVPTSSSASSAGAGPESRLYPLLGCGARCARASSRGSDDPTLRRSSEVDGGTHIRQSPTDERVPHSHR